MNLFRDNGARGHMLRSQILTGHVLAPRLLEALESVPREAFVPEKLRGAAYVDEEIPLGNGRFLMEPLAFARLLNHAAIEAHETVLDVGCATGYSSMVVAKIAQKVIALEEDDALAKAAGELLAPCPNVELVRGPLVSGASGSAPYDVIVVEGSIQFLPQALADQLREGGRLLAAQHNEDAKMATAGLGRLVEYKKVRGLLYKTPLHDASAPLLPAFKKPVSFVF